LSFSATVSGELPKILTWNTSNVTGTWNTNTANKPWTDQTSSPSNFKSGDTANLATTSSDIAITVDAAGVAPVMTNVSNGTNKYTLSGGSVSGQLNKTNAGTLVLGSANLWSVVNIEGGTVETQVNNALNNVAINLKNGATWKTSTNAQ